MTENKIKGMERSISQWRHMIPRVVMQGSPAQIAQALHDAKTDIDVLWAKVNELSAALSRARGE